MLERECMIEKKAGSIDVYSGPILEESLYKILYN